MKEASAASPFAAMTKQEQRHQWNVWHAQQNATRPVVQEKKAETASVRSLPEERPSSRAETEPKPEERKRPAQTTPQPQERRPMVQVPPAQVQTVPGTSTHHGQYQAVLRRMRQAGSHTSAFSSTDAKPEAMAFSVPMTTAQTASAPPPTGQAGSKEDAVMTVQPASGNE